MTEEEQIRAEYRRRLPTQAPAVDWGGPIQRDPEDIVVEMVLAEQATLKRDIAELERRLQMIEDYVRDGIDVDSGDDILAIIRAKP